ncbi:LacI family DNA-binding transcriptional regulator [Maritalea sp.]|uniref:LacI family DNA-binding transcriptional regulator n=1 Tax=Maritalea sp. TaxID=2003361 RepID=UPI003EFA2E5A
MNWLKLLTKQPSLKMIAERTGFAVTTISKALRDAPNISQKTKQYVRSIADELGYQPDRAGVSLRTGKTNKIVLLMPLEHEISDFSRRLILGMARILERTPYELVFHPILPDHTELDEIKKIVRNRSADGLVLAQTAPNDPRILYAQEHNFPVVTHGRTCIETAHAFYDFDNQMFAYLAGMRLAELGCKSIGLLAPEKDLTYYQHLLAGLHQVVEETSCEISSFRAQAQPGGDYVRWLREETLCAMQNGTMPQGVICSGEMAAMAVIDGVSSAGGKVGHDVKIISRKTSSLLEYLHPRIEWVEEDLIQAGEHLAQFLLQRIKGADPEELQFISPPALSW